MPIKSTSSFDLAIFLAATFPEDHSMRLLSVHPVEPGSQKLKFVFDDPADCMLEFERHFLQGGKAPALAMMATMRRIRKLMELEKAKQQATTTPQERNI